MWTSTQDYSYGNWQFAFLLLYILYIFYQKEKTSKNNLLKPFNVWKLKKNF